ncbi:hypothetical protein QR721_08850 [Aciduricibacillus chroicocephali]|uniref:Uncharacterized protein n=1 Tax=Aciduricibacillus chroicocephali TaxID=3054939 RepID=A0ABY9KT62_9BACI|nr:hypothetical protein QR721_08850 [Bacillaceae bacterium 44XB]
MKRVQMLNETAVIGSLAKNLKMVEFDLKRKLLCWSNENSEQMVGYRVAVLRE